MTEKQAAHDQAKNVSLENLSWGFTFRHIEPGLAQPPCVSKRRLVAPWRSLMH